MKQNKRRALQNIYLSLFLLFVANSCDKDPEERNVIVTIANVSGKDLKIYDYNSITNKLNTLFEISNGDEIAQKFIETEGLFDRGPRDFFEGDSIVIIYGNQEKKSVYICPENSFTQSCERDGNILNVNDGKWNLTVDNGTELLRYNFNEMDFAEASDCNGSCK